MQTGGLDKSLIERQFDFSAVSQQQAPGLAAKISPKLGAYILLQRAQIDLLWPDLRRKTRQLRPLAIERQIIFRTLMQATDGLAATLDGLFMLTILSPDPQSKLPAAQAPIFGIKIDIGQVPIRVAQHGISRHLPGQIGRKIPVG